VHPAASPALPAARRSVAVAAAQGASTVRVNVQGRHLEVTDALKAYAVSLVALRGRRAAPGGFQNKRAAFFCCFEGDARAKRACPLHVRVASASARVLRA
jgi:hypothetical protein